MHRALLRAPFVIAFAAIVLTVGTWTAPSSAKAEAEPSRFVLTVFPQDTDEVGFSNSWGNSRSGGRAHRGTDIIGPRGTEVYAAADGVITELGHHYLSGFFIRIDHGEDWTTTYMHLNNDTVGTDDGEGGTWTAFYATLVEGDEVEAGQVIGYVGDSGNAEGTVPHTHFEVTYEGQKLNPYSYLTEVFERELRLASNAGFPI